MILTTVGNISPMLLFILVVTFFWLRWLWSRRHLYSASRQIAGPTSWPIFGNIHQVGCFQHLKLVYNMEHLMKKYDGFFRLWIGPIFMVCITEARDFECVVLSKKTYNKGMQYDMINFALGNGLLVSNGSHWKKHRQIINPTFALSTMKKYQRKHNHYAKKLIVCMEDFLDQGIVEVSTCVARFFADTFCDNLFGFQTDFCAGKDDNVLTSTFRSIIKIHYRLWQFWLYNDAIYKRSASYRDFATDYKAFSDFFHPRLLKRAQAYIDELKKNNQEAKKTKSLSNDFDADYILNEETSITGETVTKVLAENFSTSDIISEFNNIFVPGLDTCHTQLSAFILMMGMHKGAQDKVWHELKDFYSYDLDAEVTHEHFSHLPYLDMTIKETMRLFPSGAVTARKLEEDFFLKSRNVTLPAGTQILLLSHLLHKNEKHWKNPMEFIPERFSSDESAKRPHFAFIPFSAGLRNCIGQVFGLDTVKIGAIHLMRRFEFTADPSCTTENLSYIVDASTRSESGYNVKVMRRNRENGVS